MSDYTYTGGFAAKDTLTTGDVNKRILGADVENQLTAVATAISSKANSASPALTGSATGVNLSLSGTLGVAGVATLTGGRATVQTSGTPMVEIHIPGDIAQALSMATGEGLRIHSSNGSGTLSAKLLNLTQAGVLTLPLQPSFHAYRTADQTSGDEIIFNNEFHDTASNYDATTGRFTAPVTGIYQFNWAVTIYNTGGAATKGIYLRVSGATIYTAQVETFGAGEVKTLTGGVTMSLAAGAYVSLDRAPVGSWDAADDYIYGSYVATFSGIKIA